jgi:hypothetical protein
MNQEESQIALRSSKGFVFESRKSCSEGTEAAMQTCAPNPPWFKRS